MVEQQTGIMKVVTFRLNDELYGVDVQQVLSIERMTHMTRVPNLPDYVKGVINLRGIITPVIDLRERFEIETVEETKHTRMIIVSVEEIEVGLIVDAAQDVVDIPIEVIEPPPEIVGQVEVDYLHGVAKLEERLLILLNLNKVLNVEEIQELAEIEV